ncbi:hypothetical protein DT73_21825 [Mangrovibacter sp. MFB070]|uniref:hypothetical protein n=1 Tax=Mangrovibacter sp. MFB070 TaxID=1224318 RepID=UPI0004D65762|nr:hypothetical protein [Mangrovibacter sp. MFB070]KEA50695.1 hypothetical protein DT73_21825 [Mangrovibacter sp. MFB070]
MDNDVTFSLSYELLLEVTENEIKRCDLRQGTDHYVQALTKAHDLLHFWHTLVMRGYPLLPDVERVNRDFQYLASLMKAGKGEDA